MCFLNNKALVVVVGSAVCATHTARFGGNVAISDKNTRLVFSGLRRMGIKLVTVLCDGADYRSVVVAFLFSVAPRWGGK